MLSIKHLKYAQQCSTWTFNYDLIESIEKNIPDNLQQSQFPLAGKPCMCNKVSMEQCQSHYCNMLKRFLGRVTESISDLLFLKQQTQRQLLENLLYIAFSSNFHYVLMSYYKLATNSPGYVHKCSFGEWFCKVWVTAAVNVVPKHYLVWYRTF